MATRMHEPQEQDEPVDAVIAEYLRALGARQAENCERIKAAHPELAEEFELFLQDYARVAALADPCPGGEPPILPRGRDGRDCPSCGTRLEPGGGDEFSADCGQCGWRVHFVDGTPLPVGRDGLLGKYELLGVLGKGGFGVVFRAHDSSLDREVAIKAPRARALSGPGGLNRFLREGRNASRLSHPAIVRVHEASQINGMPCLVSD